MSRNKLNHIFVKVQKKSFEIELCIFMEKKWITMPICICKIHVNVIFKDVFDLVELMDFNDRTGTFCF